MVTLISKSMNIVLILTAKTFMILKGMLRI